MSHVGALGIYVVSWAALATTHGTLATVAQVFQHAKSALRFLKVGPHGSCCVH